MEYKIEGSWTHEGLSRVFDHQNIHWRQDRELNKMFLEANERWVNDMLHLKGYILLNEVYRALGFNETSEGAVLGWSMKVCDDNQIAFIGLEKDNRWFLEFTVNGVIVDLIGDKKDGLYSGTQIE